LWKKRLATTVGIFRLRPPPKNLTKLPDQLKVPTVASFMTISLPSHQTIPVIIGKATKRVSSASSKSSTAYKIPMACLKFPGPKVFVDRSGENTIPLPAVKPV